MHFVCLNRHELTNVGHGFSHSTAGCKAKHKDTDIEAFLLRLQQSNAAGVK
jgi:hypothetical protein